MGWQVKFVTQHPVGEGYQVVVADFHPFRRTGCPRGKQDVGEVVPRDGVRVIKRFVRVDGLVDGVTVNYRYIHHQLLARELVNCQH